MYFSKFPLTLYLDENSELKILTDISKTFDVTGSLSSANDIMTYSIKDGDTPESLSYKLSNTTSNSWIIMMLNRMMDSNYDWPMDSNTFDHYINKKYGNKICLFVDISNTFGTFTKDSFIRIIDEDNEQKAAGFVDSWDRTYGKLILRDYSGNFEDITQKLKTKTIKYFAKIDINNIAKIGRIVISNSQALHHFESDNKIYLDPHSGLLDAYSLYDSNNFVVTNYQYEIEQNDEKRRIILPSRKLIEKIKKDFNDKKFN